MTDQKDWIKPIAEPKTYPGTLRGYRHFKNTAKNSEVRLQPINAAFDYPAIPEDEWWLSFCTKKIEHEKVPDKDCTCGFYINYFPTESFYPSNDWDLPRGVVEASGKIVLSKKGFRAEKMRLVALFTEYCRVWKYVSDSFPYVKIFFDKEEMYEAYPQDDLTALIGTDEERLKPEPMSLSELVNQQLMHINPNSWATSLAVTYNTYTAPHTNLQNNTWSVATSQGVFKFDFSARMLKIDQTTNILNIPFSQLGNMRIVNGMCGSVIGNISFTYQGYDYVITEHGHLTWQRNYNYDTIRYFKP